MIDLLSPALPRVFGALLVSIGLVMAGGGLCLIWLGGSPYYAIFGALLIVSGLLAATKRHGGALVYCAALLLPMTYTSEKSGRQFVVIAAGGHAGIGTTHGDAVVAFALPAR